MKAEDIKNVLIVGSGTMGQEIGFQCARAELQVTFYDVSDDVLAAAMDRLKTSTSLQAAAGLYTVKEAEAAHKRLKTSSDLEAAISSADFISESVPENIELKRKAWGEIGRLAPEHTIFTTNTSSLAPSEYAEATGRPDRFAAFHFHLPVADNRIADVMTHGRTSKETMDLVEAFAKRIDIIPIRIEEEAPEYVFNAMLIAFLTAAGKLHAGGIASTEDIDRTWMSIMGVPVGPFGIMDGVGLDTCWGIMNGIAERGSDTGLKAMVDLIKEKVDRGELGAKSGKGFYDYPAPAFAMEGFLGGK